MLLNLNKKLLIICNMVNLIDKLTIDFLLDGKLKTSCKFEGGGTFTRPDGSEACVSVIGLTNLEVPEDNDNFKFKVPTLTKAQLLEKGVLYRPDGMPDNHYEVRFIKNIPIDLKEDEVVWVPITALLAPWYINRYAVQKDLFISHNKIIKVNGKTRFYRFPVKVKDQ